MFIRTSKRLIRPTGKGEHGIALAFVAVISTALFVLLAAAIETARIYLVKRQAQAATDAAALAAAAGIPHYRGLPTQQDALNDSTVISLLKSFNGTQQYSNLVMGGSPSLMTADLTFFRFENGAVHLLNMGEEYTFADGVRVQHTYSLPLIFGRFLGASTVSIRTESFAQVGGAPGMFTVDLPIALLSCPVPKPAPNNNIGQQASCGQTFTLVAKEENGVHDASLNPAPSDTAAIFAPKGTVPSANWCKDRVNQTNDPMVVAMGGEINLNNGNQASCLHEMQQRCRFLQCGPNRPWIATVPVVDCLDFRNPGNPQLVQDAPVRAFARIGITEVTAAGKTKTIKFKLLCDESQLAAPPSTGRAYGFYSPPILIQ